METNELVKRSKDLEIATDEDYAVAGEWLKIVRDFRKDIQASFQPIVKAAFEAHRKAISQQKEKETPFIEAEEHLKHAMAFYQAKKEIEANEAAKAMAVLDEPMEMFAPIAAPPVKVEGVSHRENWKFVVENMKLVPREYLVADLTKIAGVVRAMKGATRIPGVRIYCEKSTVVR